MPTPPTKKCVQLYLSGNVKVFDHSESDARKWLSYSKDMRPGCALFLDDKCEQTGYYRSVEEATEAYNKAKNDLSLRIYS